MRELRATAYRNTTWRKLRDTYIKEHALCEECLSKGIIKPSEDIHHIKSPFANGEINYTLLLDYTNLQALCKTCHANKHNNRKDQRTPIDILKQLDDLFNESIPDKDLE